MFDRTSNETNKAEGIANFIPFFSNKSPSTACNGSAELKTLVSADVEANSFSHGFVLCKMFLRHKLPT